MPVARNLLAATGIAFAISIFSTVFSAPSQAQFSDSWEFLKAVEEVDYREMRNRIFKGANVNRKNGDGLPAMVIAADKGDKELIRFLMEQGVKIDATTEDRGETAAMRRAGVGDMDTLNLLMELGADINLQDRSGLTALMRAARSRKQRVVKQLLDRGADFPGPIIPASLHWDTRATSGPGALLNFLKMQGRSSSLNNDDQFLFISFTW